jgi:hypothetical protein
VLLAALLDEDALASLLVPSLGISVRASSRPAVFQRVTG